MVGSPFTVRRSPWKGWLLGLVVVLVVMGLGLRQPARVWAGEEACTDPEYPYCYDHTIINQWACETC